MTLLVGTSHGKSPRYLPSLVAIRIVVVDMCLVVVEQDTFSSLKFAIIIISKTRSMEICGHAILVSPILVTRN